MKRMGYRDRTDDLYRVNPVGVLYLIESFFAFLSGRRLFSMVFGTYSSQIDPKLTRRGFLSGFVELVRGL